MMLLLLRPTSNIKERAVSVSLSVNIIQVSQVFLSLVQTVCWDQQCQSQTQAWILGGKAVRRQKCWAEHTAEGFTFNPALLRLGGERGGGGMFKYFISPADDELKLSKYQGTELPIKYLALTNQICRGFFVVQKSYFTCGGFLYQMFLLVFSFTVWLTGKEREVWVRA